MMIAMLQAQAPSKVIIARKNTQQAIMKEPATATQTASKELSVNTRNWLSTLRIKVYGFKPLPKNKKEGC